MAKRSLLSRFPSYYRNFNWPLRTSISVNESTNNDLYWGSSLEGMGFFSIPTISNWILWSYSLLTDGMKVSFRLQRKWLQNETFMTSIWSITVWCLGIGRASVLIRCWNEVRTVFWRAGKYNIFYGKPEYNKVGQFYVHGSMHHESVSIIVQWDATIYSFIIFLQTALRVSDDTLIHHQEHTQTVITISGTSRTVPDVVIAVWVCSWWWGYHPKHAELSAEI